MSLQPKHPRFTLPEAENRPARYYFDQHGLTPITLLTTVGGFDIYQDNEGRLWAVGIVRETGYVRVTSNDEQFHDPDFWAADQGHAEAVAFVESYKLLTS